MSLFKICCVLLVTGILGACGFQPLYYRDGERSSIRTDMTSVFVRPIKDRIGQDLRNNLKDALNPTGIHSEKKWNLTVELSESIQEISLESTSFSTRANLIVAARVGVTRADGTPVSTNDDGSSVNYARSIQAISSYNIVDSDYADIVAERDARSRAVVSLGNDIRRQVALWLREAED